MSRFYIAADDRGMLLGTSFQITDEPIVTEPFDLRLDATKNSDLQHELEFAREFNMTELLVARNYRIAFADPTRIDINGYSRYRVFSVEPVGEHEILDGILIADEVHVVAEVTPALVFGETELYRRIMEMHVRTYGASENDRTVLDLCDSFDVYDKLSKLEGAKTFNTKKFAEDDAVAMQIFISMVWDEFEDENPSMLRIMENAASLLPTSILPYAYTTVYEWMTHRAQNEDLASPVLDELSDIINDLAYDHFDDTL